MSREGSLEAPTRHPLDWKSVAFYDINDLNQELERVFDICHGCRRCVSLCEAFPTLFDLVDGSETLEVDGIDKSDYTKVVEQCYLCDLCYMTKCPYVPPHEWNVDFPHLMLRAKAVKFGKQGASFRDSTLTSTDTVGKFASLPVIDSIVNSLNKNGVFRGLLASVLRVHAKAPLPQYHHNNLRKRVKALDKTVKSIAVNNTTGKVAVFATCYGNYNQPQLGEDLFKVFQHNNIHIEVAPKEQCCGMPKMELGDLQAVARAKEANIPVLAKLVDAGYDLTALIPSCVLMFKQELPLMFPDDPDVIKVQQAFFDPFEYLWLRHKGGQFNTDFKQSLGEVSYHLACHLRVQNIGVKARDILELVPDTKVQTIERCSGHDGTYAVRLETRDKSVKIARPVVRKVEQAMANHFASDCPMAATHIAELSDKIKEATHPIALLCLAYGLS